ncbi:MAG: hypothetical protein D4R67_08680 [Bacteroidetes bacterium]|nr:MAG: hypothetical protein D4R67_08680 [Bacteroidota bacterium]
METLGTIIIVGTVFYGVYYLIKGYTDYLLKRKIVKAGHIEKAGILEAPVAPSAEANRYPSLKWGLVALLAGAGLILIEILRNTGAIEFIDGKDTFLPIGIELVAISLGFLIYFFIVNAKGMKGR